jgi:hypothetical protein
MAGNASPVSTEPASAPEPQAVAVKQLECCVRDEHLARLGGVADPRRDVDVDAEQVAAEPSRSSVVDTGSHPRPVAVDRDSLQRVVGVERRVDRALDRRERCHQSVAESLDDLSLVPEYGRFHHRPDFAQEPEHSFVAGLQSPGRESDQVGEQQRERFVTGPSPRRF